MGENKHTASNVVCGKCRFIKTLEMKKYTKGPPNVIVVRRRLSSSVVVARAIFSKNSARFLRGSKKRKSNNDDKHLHGQEKGDPQHVLREQKLAVAANSSKSCDQQPLAFSRKNYETVKTIVTL